MSDKYQSHSETSRAAAYFISPFSGAMRERVFLTICEQDCGATDDELQLILNMKHQTETPRRIELEELGLIVDSGRVRKTRAGLDAIVWIATGKKYDKNEFLVRQKRKGRKRDQEQAVLTAAYQYAEDPTKMREVSLRLASKKLEKG